MSGNKLNHQEAVSRIVQISKKTDIKVEQARKQLFDVLDMTDARDYDNVINGVVASYKKAEGYNEKQKLQIMSPLIASYVKGEIGHRKKEKITTNAGKVTLIREKDSTGKYKVYRYQVRQWGYPKHIRNEYAKQIKGKIDGVKITDSKGKEYPENKKFIAGELVYIKAPITAVEKIDAGTKERIRIQEEYIENQDKARKETLEKFNKQHPMGKDVELSFGIPVYKYADIDKTLTSITTNQNIDPKKYEIVLLLNRPNKTKEFDKVTKEKILKFKLNHPEYNIHIFEHTFDFENKAKMGKIYKLLGDTIVYRNIQRKNIQGMDMNKIRNLIMKTGGADSTDKNPNYIQNQIDKYSKKYNGKELVRMTGESRIPADLAKAYPLLEIDEFFQRYYDLEYKGGDPLKRDVGIGSYKARAYSGSGGFDGSRFIQEDTGFVRRVKNFVNTRPDVTMYHDKDFVGAVDNSTDRGICSIIHDIPYCNRYNTSGFGNNDETKNREWNNRAIENKGKPETEKLELTTVNLERDLSAFYRQRLEMAKKGSIKFSNYITTPEGQAASKAEKDKWALKNVVNPIMEKILQKPDFMGLSRGDYELYIDGTGTPRIKFNESAITKIKAVQRKKIADGYYDYRK